MNKQGSINLVSRAQSSSINPPGRDARRGATSCIGEGTYHLYALNNLQEHENVPDSYTGIFQVCHFIVY